MKLWLRASAPIIGIHHRCRQTGRTVGIPTTEVRLAAAEAWLLLGNADEAERELAELSYRERHRPSALRLGVQIALALKLPMEALDLAAKLTALESENPLAWQLLLKVALDGCGRTDWALRILREAAIHLPEHQEINASLALVLAVTGGAYAPMAARA